MAEPSVVDADHHLELRAQAAKEVAGLPRDASERVIAEPALLHVQHVLGQNPSRDPDEQEFIMVMQKTWEDARTEGYAEARADDVLTVLRVRSIAVPDAARERILAQKDLTRIA